MSSLTRGGGQRGGERGKSFGRGRAGSRGGSSGGRGRGGQTSSRNASPAPRGAGFQAIPSSGNGVVRGGGNPGLGNAFGRQSTPRAVGASSVAQARGSWQDRYANLEASRKRERAQAIKNGIIADPDKPRTLAEAITPVGTCPDMCAEFERVERVVQKDVWAEETDPNQSVYGPLDREPDESRMVKKFRRAAAGIEEQLPSDLRPPSVLKNTCDYLFNDVVGQASELAKVHHFVWDRTRAIRNDFSIQQISKPEELSIAVECYERIARFHILSLHQLALPRKPYDKYDWQQEREQLDRTLLSLMQYYDDSRKRIQLPNEPEFRAYCVIFQLQDPVPDLEDRLQSWPRGIAMHPRIREAAQLYAAACNAIDLQGPLKPPATHAIAQQDWYRFWRLVESNGISYLMACVAEIYFNLIRRTVLQALLKSGGTKYTVQWTLDDMRLMLAFDDDGEVEEFCERYDLSFKEEGGRALLDLSVLKNKTLPDAKASATKQTKSGLVEQKRCGRMFPAVINGLSVRQATDQGLLEDKAMDDVMDAGEEHVETDDVVDDGISDDDDSLFVRDTASKPTEPVVSTSSPFAAPQASQTPFSAFGQPSQSTGSAFGKPSLFEKPAEPAAPSNPFAKAAASLGLQAEKPKFNFLSTSTSQPSANFPATSTAPSLFQNLGGAKPAVSFAIPDSEPTVGTEEKERTSQGDDTEVRETSLFSAASKTSPETKNTFAFPKPQVAATDNSSAFDATATAAKAVPLPAPTFTQPTPSPMTNSQEASSTKVSDLFGVPSQFAKPHAAPSFASNTLQPSQSIAQDTSQHLSNATTNNQPNPISGLNSAVTPFGTSQFSWTKEANSAAPSQSLKETPAKVINTDDASGQPFAKLAGADITSAFDAPQLKHIVKATPPLLPPTSPEPDFGSILDRLAKDLTLDPDTGFLKQYVDFYMSQVITEVQEQLHFTQIEAEAKDFRTHVLALRYGTRWRDTCRRLRLAKHGRDRRRRAFQRLHEQKSQKSETDSVAGDTSVFGGSQAPPVTRGAPRRQDERRDLVDKMFQQSMGPGRWSRTAASGPQRTARHRATGSLGSDTSHDDRSQEATPHSRSTSHVDSTGRVTKPSTADKHLTSLLKRSSLFGGAPSPARSTTRSNYFRCKALGIAPIDNARARKRQYSEMAESQSRRSSMSILQSSSPLAITGHATVDKFHGEPTNTVSKTVKTTEEDDALFARLRAARDNLKEGTAYFQSYTSGTADKSEASAPINLYESPSLATARQEARWRASLSASENGVPDEDVPAYRLRESKFVPRGQYGQAIERARNFRESRSQNGSQSVSQANTAGNNTPASNGLSAGRSSTLHNATGTFDQLNPRESQAARSNTMQHPKSNATILSEHNNTNETRFSTFAPHESLSSAPSAGVGTFTAQDNAFGSLETYAGTASYLSTTAGTNTQDHTIKPSQIPQSLSASFGEGHGEPQPFTHSGYPASAHPNMKSHHHESSMNQHGKIDHGGAGFGQYAASNLVNGDKLQNDYGHANPFAILGDEVEQESMGENDEEEVDLNDGEGDDSSANVYNQDDELYEEEGYDGTDGDIEGEEGYDEEYDEEEDDSDAEQGQQAQPHWHRMGVAAAAQPKPNATLQTVGNTENDAIELSD